MGGQRSKSWKTASKGSIWVAGLCLLLPALWLFSAYDRQFGVCVSLKNGLVLGYEAVFDVSRPYLRPIAVPKLADGTPLIREETWEIFVTDTTLYGLTMGASAAENYAFVWRADTGLVRQRDDSATYDRLVAEAGPANWDIEIGSVGTGWLLAELLRRPELLDHQGTADQRCATRLLTW
ncbi:MAG: hypothetical protein E6Q73_06555 [Pseudorhodobacter sp.]|nr:MAG: hypothetical protein E6Q73_06555 [Pseudorhodobacter sp.]